MRLDFLQVTGRANRRRLRVFAATLGVALCVSLGFTWLRAPEYRASSRLEIAPANGAESPVPFLTELQVLTSRPILEPAVASLTRSGYDVSALGPDPVAGMQSRLEAIPVPGTNVVELSATGKRPDLLAPLINTTVSVYQDRLATAYRDSTGESQARADDEVAKLQAIVTTKRRDVEAFRMRNNIVSLEREESEVLARVRNLNTSLRSANERVAAAEGKLRSLTESAAAGEVVARSRDDPTLANLEQRASQIREELRSLERTFTPDYMAKDPSIIAQRTRLAELEGQIKAQLVVGQKAALLEAKQELASAQGATARIQSEMSLGRQEAMQFTARFNEYKSRQDELAELETAYRDAVQRRAKLEATERARRPTSHVLEAATTPREPWRPMYWRDTAVSVGGSLMLALLAMWLVEMFNRPDARPAVVLIQPSSAAQLRDIAPPALAANGAPALETAEPTLLPRQTSFPRELRDDEVSALIRASNASDDGGLVAMLLLLSGASLDEALKLRWSDVDLVNNRIRVGDEQGRDVVLAGALRRVLARRAKEPGSNVVGAHGGRPATSDGVEAQILCAALDAGIDDATQITSDSLWHTYVAHLVRQGIRFVDLTRLVGNLSPEIVRRYSVLSPPGSRDRSHEIELVLPALRDDRV